MKLKALMAFSVLASVLAVPVVAAPGGKGNPHVMEGDHAVKAQGNARVREHQDDDDVEADDNDVKAGPQRGHGHDHDDAGDDDDDHVSGSGPDKAKPLPPGLQKKLDRGGELPPGWQKKLQAGQVLDAEVYAKRKVLKPAGKKGNELIQVEDKILKVNQKTREIREIRDAVEALDD